MRAADVGLVGLARLGRDLALNLADHGFDVVVHNRTAARVDAFLRGPAAGRRNVTAASSIENLTEQLSRPRRVVLTVRAGTAPDEVIGQLLPHLEAGDVVVDAGNSHFADTARRAKLLEESGVLFVGAGIAAGEAGARHEPSIMPGGNPKAWPLVSDMLRSIAARSSDGEPACDWLGEGGAGHFAKMVHNGVEYTEMQLLGEAYHVLRDALRLSASEMHQTFFDWNRGELESYLLAITADIVDFPDEDGAPLLERILDVAAQTGTGSWTAASALELGVPATLVAEAVYARSLSALKDDRIAVASVLDWPTTELGGDRDALVEDLRQAVLASRIVCHAQTHMLVRRASDVHGWHLSYATVASLWQGGQIVRSRLLGRIRDAFREDPELRSLLLDERFRTVVDRCQASWRRVVATVTELGVPIPATSAALAFFDGYRSRRLPAGLLQAQRDYFAAHGYERVDRERGREFHTDWTGGRLPPRTS